MPKSHSMKKIIDNLEAVASFLQKNREPKAAAKLAKIAIKLLSQDYDVAQPKSAAEEEEANVNATGHAQHLHKLLTKHKKKMKMTPELAKDLLKLHEHMTKGGA